MHRPSLIIILILLIAASVHASCEDCKQSSSRFPSDLQRSAAYSVSARAAESSQVIITFAHNDPQAMNAVVEFIGQEHVKHRFDNAIAAVVTRQQLASLAQSKNVARIETDKPVSASLQDTVRLINATSAQKTQIQGKNLSGAGQTICVIDTGIDYTHPDIAGCNPATQPRIAAQTAASPGFPSSYANNLNYNISISKSGYKSIAVHFTTIDVEENFDYVDIIDKDGNLIWWYTGTLQDVWSPAVEGDHLTVRLLTDGSINRSGFKIDKVRDETIDWSSCGRFLGGFDFAGHTTNPKDYNGHGTHVAGIAAARGGITGVAPGANLLSVRSLDDFGYGYTSDIVAGIKYCTQRATELNISVISMSLGTADEYTNNCDAEESAFASAVDDAVARNISVVVAAGNSGSTTSLSAPACLRNALAVGATTKKDTVASYSNRNRLLQIVAPGGDQAAPVNSTKMGGGYIGIAGTSMATPHVSATIALLRQELALQGITRTPSELKSLLSSTGKPIYDASSGITFARIDAMAAVSSLLPASPQPGACFTSATTIPATCTGGVMSSDVVSGACRTMLCTSSGSSMKVLACDKGAFFEMYKQAQSGTGIKSICLGATCITNGGFAKSINFPICMGQPAATNFTLNIQSTPSAAISINGTSYGTTPKSIVLAKGTYLVALSADGYVPNASTVTLDRDLSLNVIMQKSAPAGSCYSTIGSVPATCTGGVMSSDVLAGSCRTLVCAGSGSSMKVLACDKGAFFEMYKQAQSGTGITSLCLGKSCITDNGFARSANYPVCG